MSAPQMPACTETTMNRINAKGKFVNYGWTRHNLTPAKLTYWKEQDYATLLKMALINYDSFLNYLA